MSATGTSMSSVLPVSWMSTMDTDFLGFSVIVAVAKFMSTLLPVSILRLSTFPANTTVFSAGLCWALGWAVVVALAGAVPVADLGEVPLLDCWQLAVDTKRTNATNGTKFFVIAFGLKVVFVLISFLLLRQ